MERLRESEKDLKPVNYGRKLIVTEFQLDSWYASQYNLDISNIPSYKP